MKCPSCKYENRYRSKVVDDVVRYKSGKNKGEIKEVNKKTIEFYKDDPEFIEISTDQKDEFKADLDNYFSGVCVSLYACPMCGTVILKDINDYWTC